MQLHGHIGEIESRGAKLHLIGSGAPNFIAGFREETGFTGSIYTDPSLKSFEAAGLVRSVRASVGLRSISAGVKSFAKGQRQGKRQGDPWQQGGALIINKAGELLFAHQSAAGGDNVTGSALLQVLSSAAE